MSLVLQAPLPRLSISRTGNILPLRRQIITYRKLFQIFHVLVIAAAFVHYHGMANMAVYRCWLYLIGKCFLLRLYIQTFSGWPRLACALWMKLSFPQRLRRCPYSKFGLTVKPWKDNSKFQPIQPHSRNFKLRLYQKPFWGRTSKEGPFC